MGSKRVEESYDYLIRSGNSPNIRNWEMHIFYTIRHMIKWGQPPILLGTVPILSGCLTREAPENEPTQSATGEKGKVGTLPAFFRNPLFPTVNSFIPNVINFRLPDPDGQFTQYSELGNAHFLYNSPYDKTGTAPDTAGDSPHFIRLPPKAGTRKRANAKCDRIRKSEFIKVEKAGAG